MYNSGSLDSRLFCGALSFRDPTFGRDAACIVVGLGPILDRTKVRLQTVARISLIFLGVVHVKQYA